MASNDKSILKLNVATSMSANDVLVVCKDPAGVPKTSIITTSALFGNVVVGATFKANVVANAVSVSTFGVGDKRTPGSSTEVIARGRIWFDDNYIYVAVSDNHIKRVALVDF